MAKPEVHARNSARKFGGEPKDYLAIHDLMDDPKSVHASVRFRTVFHHAYGIFLVEKVLGHSITNSKGRSVSVRDVAEQHVLEDLGRIPSLDEYLNVMEIQPWMAGAGKVRPVVLVD